VVFVRALVLLQNPFPLVTFFLVAFLRSPQEGMRLLFTAADREQSNARDELMQRGNIYERELWTIGRGYIQQQTNFLLAGPLTPFPCRYSFNGHRHANPRSRLELPRIIALCLWRRGLRLPPALLIHLLSFLRRADCANCHLILS
jgi:hypothetical protein